MNRKRSLIALVLTLVLSVVISKTVGVKAAFSLLGGALFTIGMLRVLEHWFSQKSKPQNFAYLRMSGAFELLLFLVLGVVLSFLIDFSAAFNFLGGGTFLLCLLATYRLWFKKEYS